MSTRKIKNAVNNTTGELIYFKGHAKATFMSDGSTVEDTINNIESKIDLSDYVKSEELEGYAKREDIPSLEGYAKSEDIPSLDGYVQSSELPNFDEFAKEEDIPSLYGYATQQWVNEQEFAHQDDLLNMSFNDIQDSPITENNDGEVNIVDENGNIALKVNEEGLYVKDVIAGDNVLSQKQDKLVSGDNIKTINGESILGSGDINIEVGGPTLTESDIAEMGFTKNTGTVQSVETSETLDEVNTTTYVKYVAQTLTDAQKAQARANIGAAAVGEGGSGGSGGLINYPKLNIDLYEADEYGIEPNKYYIIENVSPLDVLYVTLVEPTDNTIINEYVFEFYVDGNEWSLGEPALCLPDDIKWANDTPPEIKVDKTYVISIVNNLAVFVECSGRLN